MSETTDPTAGERCESCGCEPDARGLCPWCDPAKPDATAGERRVNACKCGDCYHPAFECRDCGCPSADHTPAEPDAGDVERRRDLQRDDWDRLCDLADAYLARAEAAEARLAAVEALADLYELAADSTALVSASNVSEAIRAALANGGRAR